MPTVPVKVAPLRMPWGSYGASRSNNTAAADLSPSHAAESAQNVVLVSQM